MPVCSATQRRSARSRVRSPAGSRVPLGRAQGPAPPDGPIPSVGHEAIGAREMRLRKWLLLVLALSLVVAACGDDDGETTTTTAAETTTTTEAAGLQTIEP